jgi:hypothetical protein
LDHLQEVKQGGKGGRRRRRRRRRREKGILDKLRPSINTFRSFVCLSVQSPFPDTTTD